MGSGMPHERRKEKPRPKKVISTTPHQQGEALGVRSNASSKERGDKTQLLPPRGLSVVLPGPEPPPFSLLLSKVTRLPRPAATPTSPATTTPRIHAATWSDYPTQLDLPQAATGGVANQTGTAQLSPKHARSTLRSEGPAPSYVSNEENV